MEKGANRGRGSRGIRDTTAAMLCVACGRRKKVAGLGDQWQRETSERSGDPREEFSHVGVIMGRFGQMGQPVRVRTLAIVGLRPIFL